MVDIEYNNVKVSVPENWGDITLGFYETFYTEKPQTARDRVAYVAKVCNTDVDILREWPAEVFNIIVDRIDFLFKDNPAQSSPEITIDKVKYVVPIEDELTLGEWVDIDEVQKKGENVLSNTLAIVCRPPGEDYSYKNNETRAALFAAQPVSSVLGVLAFFLRCKMVYEQRTAAYTKLAQTAALLPQSIKPFRSPGGGIKLSLIWPTLKYFVSIVLLRYQLQKFLRSCNTKKIKSTPKKPSVN